MEENLREMAVLRNKLFGGAAGKEEVDCIVQRLEELLEELTPAEKKRIEELNLRSLYPSW